MTTADGRAPCRRVLEIGLPGPVGQAAALAGKLLAGHGHDVISISPHAIDSPSADRLWRDTGKRRVILDWRMPSANPDLDRLLAGADILLDASGPHGLAALGLDAAALRERYPELVAVCLSAYGHSGPRRHYEAEQITLYATSGLMVATGVGDREPLNAGVPISADSAGLKACTAALMGLYRRGRDGGGDVIELSLQEAAMDNIEIALAQTLNGGQPARRNGDDHAMVPWRTYPCADGEAVITSGPMRHWLTGARLFEAPELVDSELTSMAERIKQRRRMEALMAPWLRRHRGVDIFRAGQDRGLAWGYVADLDSALASEQNETRQALVRLTPNDAKPYRMPDAPFRATDMPWSTRPAPAAATPVSTIDWPARQASRAGRGDPAPLAGVRVLDFTHDWAGPHAARVLADYGADVIKIEYPGLLDGMRGGYRERIDDHPRFWQLHRNKRSITLDLKRESHHACCRRLAATADVVIENSRPGVMARLGLGYDELCALRGDIIMLSMSAFGATGPWAKYAGYGGTIEALSGLQSLTGYRGDNSARRVREMDVINGMFGTAAAMAALLHRQQTSRGQWIDLSETETCSWLAGAAIVGRDLGVTPQRRGNRDPDHAPQGCYPCSNSRWLVLTIRDDQEWNQLKKLMGAPDWMQAPDLDTVAGRHAAHDSIDAGIAAWTATHDAEKLEALLQDHSLAAGWVRDAADLINDAHLAARGWFQTLADVRLPGLAFRFGRGGGQIKRRGPALGQDNEAIFTEFGLPASEWPDLAGAGLRTAFDNAESAAPD